MEKHGSFEQADRQRRSFGEITAMAGRIIFRRTAATEADASAPSPDLGADAEILEFNPLEHPVEADPTPPGLERRSLWKREARDQHLRDSGYNPDARFQVRRDLLSRTAVKD